jgi:hypothetical protein
LLFTIAGSNAFGMHAACKIRHASLTRPTGGNLNNAVTVKFNALSSWLFRVSSNSKNLLPLALL